MRRPSPTNVYLATERISSHVVTWRRLLGLAAQRADQMLAQAGPELLDTQLVVDLGAGRQTGRGRALTTTFTYSPAYQTFPTPGPEIP